MNDEAFTYSAFGLVVKSNLPIPGLRMSKSARRTPDINLFLGSSSYANDKVPRGPETLSYTSSLTDENGEPALQIWSITGGKYFHLAYSVGVEFWLDHAGSRLWMVWPDAGSQEEAVSYLLGPVLGILLRYRGVTCLHASAVAVDGHAVAFVGARGAGKSTTAAALAQRGYAVLSDDIVALEERKGPFYVKPAYPHLCLWPESAELICGSAEALPRLIPNWDKRRLPLGSNGTLFEKRALPLSRIYILGERTIDTVSHIEAVPMQTALMSLVANTYA
ncbi:MAG: hypothetical protein ACRD4Q_07920, partial [Candidatus Acidiferrales bacterium]